MLEILYLKLLIQNIHVAQFWIRIPNADCSCAMLFLFTAHCHLFNTKKCNIFTLKIDV